MTLKNAMICLLLIIAISLSTWSILVSTQSKPHLQVENSNLPDAVMENVVALILNKEGTPSLKVTTPKMTHYASNDATEIEKPIVTVYRHSPNPWHISSNYAKASKGISEILFWDHVVLHHLEDKENPTTTMSTDTLTIFPDKQTAQTDQAITIKQPDTIVHAIGMLANMNNGTIELLSKAEGEYAPTS